MWCWSKRIIRTHCAGMPEVCRGELWDDECWIRSSWTTWAECVLRMGGQGNVLYWWDYWVGKKWATVTAKEFFEKAEPKLWGMGCWLFNQPPLQKCHKVPYLATFENLTLQVKEQIDNRKTEISWNKNLSSRLWFYLLNFPIHFFVFASFNRSSFPLRLLSHPLLGDMSIRRSRPTINLYR